MKIRFLIPAIALIIAATGQDMPVSVSYLRLSS